jgi:hypothetical protein
MCDSILKLLDLFTGMFPYVCLATMPIFCDANWPRKILNIFSVSKSTVKDKDKDNKRTTSLLPPGKNTGCEFGIKMCINFTWNLGYTLMITVLHPVFHFGDDYFVCFIDASGRILFTEEKVKKLKDIPTHTLKIGWKHNLVGFLLISHIGLQTFLPYSHFITKVLC